MRKLFISTLILTVLMCTAARAQSGSTSATSPTLRVGDGAKSFNGVNELRFPAGCVNFSGRTAIVACSGGTGGSTGSSQNANLFFASPNGAYGLPSWRAIVAEDLPASLASTIATQAANKLFAGPASGADAAPTFRSLVEADIPALDATKMGTGAVSNTEFNFLDGVSSPLQTQLDAKASAASLSAHVADTGNPHSVTKAQVGLANVDNTSDATKNAATATLANKTLLAPTIGDFTNAAHSHQTAAGGGTLDASAIAAGTLARARLPVVPQVQAHTNADQTILTATSVVLSLNAESEDTDTMHSTVTNTSRITFTTAGKYMITAGASFSSNATGYRVLNVKLNGTTYIASNSVQAVNGNDSRVYVGRAYRFAAGDYIEIEVYHTAGVSLTIISSRAVAATLQYSPEVTATWLSN